MEKINLNCSAFDKSSSSHIEKLTLQQAIDVIKSKGYSREIQEGLIKMISRRPNGSYESFFKNITRHLNQITGESNDRIEE